VLPVSSARIWAISPRRRFTISTALKNRTGAFGKGVGCDQAGKALGGGVDGELGIRPATGGDTRVERRGRRAAVQPECVLRLSGGLRDPPALIAGDAGQVLALVDPPRDPLNHERFGEIC